MIDFETLKKQFKKEVETASEPGYSVVPYYIDSGNMVLNWVLSENFFGGYPAGRIIEIYGPPGSGKSTIGAVFLGQCQKNGIAMIDPVEGTYSKEYGETLGIDNTKLLTVTRKVKDEVDGTISISGSKTVEEVRRRITDLCKIIGKTNDKPFGLLIDSIGKLTTEQEVEKSDKRDMSKAYQLNKLVRLCEDDCRSSGITVVLINHIYTKTDGYIPEDISSGGYGVKFISSIRIAVSRKVIKDSKKDIELGYELRVECKKNNIAPSGRKASFEIMHRKPLDRYSGLLDTLLRLEMLEKVPGSHKLKFTTVEDEVTFKRQDFLTEGVKLIEERPELLRINYYD